MAEMRVIIFAVDHGFCAFVRSPSGHSLLIDCGRSANFSPVNYILANEFVGMAPWNGFRLAKFILTHPHDDHISDIERLMRQLPPAILLRQRYNWEAIKDSKVAPWEYANLDAYAAWQETYNQPATDTAWGMTVRADQFLTPHQSWGLGEAKYVNNSSIPVMLEYRGVKFFFSGDLEEKGWEALLSRPGFQQMLAGTDVFVVSHHGHASGFSTAAFEAMGRPQINVASVHHRDEHVDTRYSSPDFARGIEYGGETRYLLTTRHDGSLFFSIPAQGHPTISAVTLPDNI